MKIIAALLVACAASTAVANYPSTCYDSCRFTFCPSQDSFSPGTPDTALTNPICDKYYKIHVGHVDSTGEAYVYKYGQFIPISQYSPSGLNQNFSPSFFKSFGYDKYHSYWHDLSGVGHETPQQNQADFLHGKCFILPLTAYQVLDRPYGNVIDNVHPSNPYHDCVAFTVN
jgi:hypothetical protein